MNSAKFSPSATGWQHKKSALARYQIGWRRLKKWTEQGIVRSVKLDENKQGRRLYCLTDIDHALNDLASGREPRMAAIRGRSSA